MLAVVRVPQFAGRLFYSASYSDLGRDLIFVAIAVLAIGLIDSLETLLFVRQRRGLLSKCIFFVSFILLVLIFIQLFIYSYWSAAIGTGLRSDEVTVLLELVFSALVSAMLARISLVSVPGG